jgi:mannose-1-phosphate guanylyltransferase/mannose-6-phosphate isomerase
MKTYSIVPIVLCGGSGTRLWPLSRKNFPKQFVPLINNKSLLQLTLERIAKFGNPVITIAAEEHRFMVTDTLHQAHVTGSVILEPVARNTAAAMALGALYASKNGDPTQLLLFCPADHHIPDTTSFINTINQGVAAAEAGAIVTYGVTPTFPSTAYGYIQQGTARPDNSYHVVRFIEKPDANNAQQLILQGDTVWNAGIFLARADSLINALKQHAPDILQVCQQAMDLAAEEVVDDLYTFVRPNMATFTACRSQSIDYAVMEPHNNVAMVPFHGQWSDVGSWNAVAELIAPDAEGNRLEGQGLTMHSKNTYIHAPHRLVVALGTEDLLIIDTPDAVLVAHRDHAEHTKDIVTKLNSQPTLTDTTC